MWKIQYIECENFISFKKAELEIPQNACTLIYGINNDNLQQRNNGTGKSSIIEAISFALTGEPLRSVSKVEEIINDNADTSVVFIELFNDFDNTVLTIERTIDRKNAQIIECHKYDANNIEIELNKTSQPTVLDYNRYILDEIGLTKEDIYSNFILSNSKYKSFFDASDKAKKMMINRFSGADAVDEAIDALHKDCAPVEEHLNDIKNKKIAIDAKIDVVNSQLIEADEKKVEWEENRQRRVKELKEQLIQKREELRNINEGIKKGNEYLDAVDEIGSKIESLQSCDININDAYQKVTAMMDSMQLPKIKDYVTISKTSKEKLEEYSNSKKILQDSLAKIQEEHSDASRALDDFQERIAVFKTEVQFENNESAQDIKRTDERIDSISSQLSIAQANLDDLNHHIGDIDNSIIRLKAQIGGAIVCPKCKHKFFVDSDLSLEEAQSKLSEEQNKKEALLKDENKLRNDILDGQLQNNNYKKQIDEITAEIDKRNNELSNMMRKASELSANVDSVALKLKAIQSKITAIDGDVQIEQAKIDGILNKMYAEAIDVIDGIIERGETRLETYKTKTTSCQAAIEALNQSIEEVNHSSQGDFVLSLKESKQKFEEDLKVIVSDLEHAQKEYDKFVVQENNFVDFRSYLANKKVKAISGITNHFLELIGSNLRVEMLGYKKLKSGKIRDKITVNLLRNGIDCGSYAKFSGGERARVNLASILGLQRLTNNAAPKGKGLDLIVLDEVLEASDTTGIESSCAALNKLKVTSLMVTQNPISDNEGNTIVVTKENGFSTIINK